MSIEENILLGKTVAVSVRIDDGHVKVTGKVINIDEFFIHLLTEENKECYIAHNDPTLRIEIPNEGVLFWKKK
jgi:hypothetical protein